VTADDHAVPVSFNGGRRGTAARPTRHQEALASAEHIGATAEQQKHFELAAMDRALYSKLNNAEPGVAATPHAGVLDGKGITHSRGGLPDTSDHSAQSARGISIGINAKLQH
jgi:hypothetical protein